jgi:[NiFe] hydrogenase diaphorase moiety small subunit
MSGEINFTIDGVQVQGQAGQSILQAAALSNIYIPHLCAKRGLSPWGSCRVCTVLVNGRPQAACIQPIAEGILVENDTENLRSMRRELVEMLFVEGNHFCPFCEKSGNCELQAMGYRLGMLAPQYPYFFPVRDVDASHPDLFLDRNRCILCARCVRASQELDGKHAYGFVGRGAHKHVAANSASGLGGTDAAVGDMASEACPVGSLMKKRVGYAIPIGQRAYDTKPIGSDIEKGAQPAQAGGAR